MELRDYCNDDLWLTEALELDPNVMRDLGGPTAKEKIPQIHTRRLNSVIDKTVWYLTIVPDLDSGPVGTIGIWETDWEGSRINEMGWMILPAFQGRGLATLAGRLILDRAKAEQHCREISAFPSIDNRASNIICQKLGFSMLKEVAVAYNGPAQPSNHWKIDLGLQA
jgi:RimJ/RimL family protein N-acetyltransferase